MNIVKLKDIKLTYLAFLYTNNGKTEREMKETIPFTIVTKIIKYLRMLLLLSHFSHVQPKETKDLYIENYKTLWKKSKMTRIDGETYHVHGLEESIYSENEYTTQSNL